MEDAAQLQTAPAYSKERQLPHRCRAKARTTVCFVDAKEHVAASLIDLDAGVAFAQLVAKCLETEPE